MTYTITIERVVSDDFGDTRLNWYAHLRRGENQYWHDYYSSKPSLERVITALSELYNESPKGHEFDANVGS